MLVNMDKAMRLTSDDKQKLILKIRSGAARAFRAKGYDGVSLDSLMKESGLTRGAFYAHFKSKAVLFSEVICHEHPLLRMLEARSGEDATSLRAEMCAIFAGYLDPKNLAEVFGGCSFAALLGDVTRAGVETKTAFDTALRNICAEMARGQGREARDYLPALILATAAVRTAYASADPDLQSDILRTAHATFLAVLPTPLEPLK